MLTVRAFQIEALAIAYEQSALAHMRRHALAYFSDSLAGVSEESLNAFLRRTVEEARSFGVDTLPDVLLYMNLSLAFGEGFLARRDLSWLRDLMFDPEITSARERLRRAYREVVRMYE